MVGEVFVVSYFYCEVKSTRRLLTHPGEHPGECGAQANLVDTHGPPPNIHRLGLRTAQQSRKAAAVVGDPLPLGTTEALAARKEFVECSWTRQRRRWRR